MGSQSVSSDNQNPNFLDELDIQTNQSLEEVAQSALRRRHETESEEGRTGVDPWFLKKEKMKRNQVFLEGYVEEDEDLEEGSKGVSRTVSLTDEDLDELKGCVDLGFGFNYEEIPELCNTLPALELCYSMSQRFLDDQQHKTPLEAAETCSSASSQGSTAPPIANWKISSPGDHPEEVKARLKFWAQAVACTVKLCS